MGQESIVPLLPHCAIVYPLAVLKGSKNTAAAKEFAQYLTSNQAKTGLQKFGFILP